MIPSAPLGTDAAADRSGLGAAAGATPRWGAAERRFHFELAAHPGSVAQARRLTHARLSGWSVCADTCDNAALVISELVTNAIVHTASSRVMCELHDHDDMVRLAVRDEGCAPGEPHPSPQRPDEEHGRGLLLVDALCRAWGAQEHGPGLLVWAELPRRTDTADDTAQPRGDLGWGARPKPGRPDDTGDDQAEASGREPERHDENVPAPRRNRTAGQSPHPTPEQRRHGTPPRPYPHPGPQPHQGPHRHTATDRPPHHGPERHTPEHHGPEHHTPEQHRRGERP